MATNLSIKTSTVDPWAVQNVQGLMGRAATLPTGLSTAQQNVMRARVGNQNQQAVESGLSSLAKGLGGTTSPMYAMNAARMQAGAGSATASKMADVDVQNSQDQISNQQKNTSLQAQIGQLGLDARNQDINISQNDSAAANQLSIAKVNALKELMLKYYQGARGLGMADTWSAIEGSQQSANNRNLSDFKTQLGY